MGKAQETKRPKIHKEKFLHIKIWIQLTGGLEKNLQPSIVTDNIQVIWKKVNMVNVRKIEGNDNRPETSRVKTNIKQR